MSEPLYPLESRYLLARGSTFHTRYSPGPAPTAGGRPIVLVHGLVISSLYLVPTAERLAPFFQVFAPDLPGFGKSSKREPVRDVPGLADALATWMDAVRLEQAAFVGNSLGCQIIADFAMRYPARVRCAVLAGPTMDRHARTAAHQIGRWLVDWTMERPSLALAHLRDYYEAGIQRAYQTFRYALEDRIEEKLPHLHAPTLVVRGSRDPIAPQPWCEEVAGLLPNGRLEVIPDGPHCVNYSAPDGFAEMVRQFVEEVA